MVKNIVLSIVLFVVKKVKGEVDYFDDGFLISR